MHIKVTFKSEIRKDNYGTAERKKNKQLCSYLNFLNGRASLSPSLCFSLSHSLHLIKISYLLEPPGLLWRFPQDLQYLVESDVMHSYVML